MRSGKESRMARNILSVLVIWSFLFPALIGIGNSMVASAGEGPIEPNPSMIISGTYTTTDEFVLDENLVITGTGNFTVIGGGITVTPDYVHRWSITIQDGGSLNLIDSYLTVETDQIQPYLVLSVDVSGVFYCEKALLQFPGFVNVTGNGKMVMWDSEVSALIDIPSFVPDPTDWDFAPVFTINGNAEAHFYRSTIGYGSMFTTTDFDRNNATLGYMFDFNVEGDALVWLVDSYIGVDYESSPYTHNVLWAKDNAKVYGYNFTLDTDYQGDDRESAIRTAPPTAVVWLLRWANVSCLDNDSVPIEDVPLNPLLQPSLTPPTFPDTSTQTPHNYILNYLGKDQLTWKRTGPDGKVVLPLPTDKIDWTVDQTGPNSKFDGAYRIEGTYSGFTSSSNFSFRPYPAMDPLDGSQKVVLRFPVTVPKPDLIVSDITWDPAKLTEGENIDFTATVENQGGGSATGIYVKFYVDLQPLSNGSYIDRIDAGGSDQVTETWMNATGGGHSICVEVDFPRAISESNESNNILCKPFTIIHLRPDYEVLPGSITFPPKAYIGNPVRIDITVWNRGDIEAPENTVVVYEGDPDLGKKIGVAPVGTIPPGSTNSTFVEPVFNEPREYRICVVVDEDDAVVEKLETNNEACSILTVELAPNLAVSNNDIGIGNPCTREGEQATPQARIRNTGYIDAGPFRVDFYIDGVPFASGNSTGIAANSSEVIYSDKSWTPSTPGAHILRVEVDIDDSVKESTKADNIASKEILIFHEQMATTYTGDEELRVPATFNGSIDITGSLTIYGVDVEIRQRDMFKERFCIKVFGSGSLTLVDGARLFSNYPLVIYLTDSATLTVIGSDLVLDHEVHGDGGLYADQSSKIVMQTSSLYGDMFSTGDSVSLIGVDLLGSELYIETTSTSYIWDSEFVGVTDLSLLSDDGDLSTVDFDIRNVTFTQDLDSQLIFKGNQLVEFTSVELFTPTGEDPWTGMVTENAMVRFYWWLTVKAVDGTRSLLLPPVYPSMTIENLEKTTLQWQVLPGFPANVSGGILIFRALSQEVQENWAWVNSTYAITANATVGNTIYWPDTQEARGNWTGDVQSDLEVELQFSGLTPDFSISSVNFVGEGSESEQPVDRPLQIRATVYNSGNIASYDVEVMMKMGPEVIGYAKIDVPAAGFAVAADEWTPTSVGTKNILVTVDVNNTKKERDENNNDMPATLYVFGWPNLDISASDIQFPDGDPVELGVNRVLATVRNVGTNAATNVPVSFHDDEGWFFNTTIPRIDVGSSEVANATWIPQTPGAHDFTVIVNASNFDIYQTDYDQSNNVAVRKGVDVLTRPELVIEDVQVSANITVHTTYPVHIVLNNSGGSIARDVLVQIYLEYDTTKIPVGERVNITISPNDIEEFDITAIPHDQIGEYDLCAYADPFDDIPEPDETNNRLCRAVSMIPPTGYITLETPEDNSIFRGGESFTVRGWVAERDTDRGIPDVDITIQLEDQGGTVIGNPLYTTSKDNGRILSIFEMPSGLSCGTEYRLRVHATNETYITDETRAILTPACPVVWDWWVWVLIIVIIIVVAAVVGVTLYIRIFGLGKLVECGECGAFIPEDSTSCPKCGVEFETETAKCSNCQAWIPLKVKKCPECGVEFATGEVEMEDYKAKMKMQYEEVRTRFKEEAEKELGKTLTDEEFEDWWKAQPTFVTFDEWLKQEEDMRKMGSKPCPSCGTLNAVTATICHKCGALMVVEEEERKPPERPPEEKPKEEVPPKKVVAAPPKKAVERPPTKPAAARPVAKKPLPTVERPVPKKVIKKPVVEGRPTVVPKKVVKKPEEEKEEE